MDWRKIKGYERYYVSDTGKVVNTETGSELKPYENEKGYMRTELWKNNERTHVFVHRLVADAFIDNPDNLPQVNHKDGNKKNNHVSNLEWCTGEQNIEHAIRTGLIETRRVYAGDKLHVSKADAARSLGVSVRTINSALNGKRISCVIDGKPVYYEGEKPRPDRPRKKRINTRGWHRSVPTEGKHVFVDGVEYISIKAAARAIGSSVDSIKYALSKESASGMCKGHKVWYKGEEPREPREHRHAGGKPKKKVVVDGAMFDSTADAAKHLGINRRTMMGYVKEGRKYEGKEIAVVD